MFSDNDNPTSAAAAPAHESEPESKKDQASETQAHTEGTVSAAAHEATAAPVAQADGDPRPEQAATPAPPAAEATHAEAAHSGEATQHLDPEAAAAAEEAAGSEEMSKLIDQYSEPVESAANNEIIEVKVVAYTEHGVVVDRQTLARWMGSVAWMVKGLYDLQLKTMHRFERLFCDETPMPVLDPGRGRTKICQFWAHATDDRGWKGPAPPAVAYVFAGGRGKKEIMTQLAGFEGVLQVDGYAAYASLAGDAKIRLAYCLVHARRKTGVVPLVVGLDDVAALRLRPVLPGLASARS